MDTGSLVVPIIPIVNIRNNLTAIIIEPIHLTWSDIEGGLIIKLNKLIRIPHSLQKLDKVLLANDNSLCVVIGLCIKRHQLLVCGTFNFSDSFNS